MEKEKRLRKLERARLAASTGEAYEESDDEDDDNGGLVGGVSTANDSDNDDGGDGPGYSFPDTPGVENDKPSVAKMPSKEDKDSEDSKKSPAKPTPMSGKDLDKRLKELEAENQAAIVLVDHKEKVAEKVLEDEGIKLSKGRKRKAIDFDHRSYRQGIEDSKEIDINQRAIRDEIRVKKEGKVKKEKK